MKIIDQVKLKQPHLIPELIKQGFRPFEYVDCEPDPEFDFFDKLMREKPYKGRC